MTPITEQSERELAKIKDEVLDFILKFPGKEFATSKKVADHLKIPHNDVLILFSLFDDLGFAATLGSKEVDLFHLEYIRLNGRARKFLYLDGGFKEKYNKDRLSRSWDIAKIVIVALNAFSILWLMNEANRVSEHSLLFEYVIANKDSKIGVLESEKILTKVEFKVDSLEKAVISLNDSLASETIRLRDSIVKIKVNK